MEPDPGNMASHQGLAARSSMDTVGPKSPADSSLFVGTNLKSPVESVSTSLKSPAERSSMFPIRSPIEAPGHDSMVTVRLSEPPSLSVNTNLPVTGLASRRSIFGPECTPTSAVAPRADEQETDTVEEEIEEELEEELEPKTATPDGFQNLQEDLRDSVIDDEARDEVMSLPGREDVEESDTESVNWDELQKTEAEQAQDQDQNDNVGCAFLSPLTSVRTVPAQHGDIASDYDADHSGTQQSTEMLLARLEEENNKIATNPKGVKVKVVEQVATRRPRPPSMAQLRDMVHGPTPVALRYSVVPPPPMTDLEFYMALVKDYQQTAARLPTLLSKKIRKGIPPPLRGVVWQSMAGARDSNLLEQYDRLSGESSPYEGLIGKDLGRSFPGVDMFRDPEGDGQRMLGQVLKCFSLYDQKIGYCQGLAFLVGPLLMHMPDNQAFCTLVRLMDQYDLRACFLPDLSGLHVRIYQFRELLRQHLPTLAAHMDDLQVDPAYVSQWFLSFFAVTCPLPMLFRIYDVIFAEGASETIMRVALSLMQKNSSRILACEEMEEVLQLLLSRGLWDCYHYNADEFVDDFVSLSNVVSRERLAQLELNYREAQIATANAARTSDVTTAASRFLGRLWATTSSNGSPKSAFGALSPGLIAPSRPLSMLRRSTSKQSLASTLNSMETSSASASVLSTTSTDATTITRDSSTSFRESTAAQSKQSTLGGSNANENKALHCQIEDLLTALSELQRSHALLATQLQKEREERDEEREAVKTLLGRLKKTERDATEATEGQSNTADELSRLIEGVEGHFDAERHNHHNAGDSAQQTKSELLDEVVRAKENFMLEHGKSEELNRRIGELNEEVQKLKDDLRESRTHIRSLHQDKQRLEKQVHTMRVRASAEPPQGTSESSGGWFSSGAGAVAGAAAAAAAATGNGGGSANGGLRELKLGRSRSTPIPQGVLPKRTSIQRTQTVPAPPSDENEALLMELVQAKTAEAVARQEADEYKQQLESFKKSMGLASGEASAATGGSAANAVMGMFGGGAKNTTPPAAAAPASTPAPAATNSGGFWGWRK